MISKKLFFSYGRDLHNPHHIEIVHKVKEQLEREGFNVFMDVEQLKGGDDWEQKLELEIRQSDILLYFITPYATRLDGYCRNELAYALNLNKKIIPLMVSYEPLPLSICRLQYIDLQNIKTDQHLVSKIEQLILILKYDAVCQLAYDNIEPLSLHAHINNDIRNIESNKNTHMSNNQTQADLNQYDFPYQITKEYIQVNGIDILNDKQFIIHLNDGISQLCSFTGEVLAKLDGHKGIVKGALSTNDNKILTYSSHGTVQLWSREGKNLSKFATCDQIKNIYILDHDRFIAYCTHDNTLRIWSFYGKKLQIINLVNKGLNSVAILSHDRILLAFKNGMLKIINSTGRLIRNLDGHSDVLSGAGSLYDGRILSYSNTTVRIWDSEGENLVVLKGHKNTVKGAKVMKNGSIISYTSGGTIYIWNLNGELVSVIKAHNGPVNEIEIFEDGRILTCGSDGKLCIWNQYGEFLSSVKEQLGAFKNLYLIDDKSILTHTLNTVYLWTSKK